METEAKEPKNDFKNATTLELSIASIETQLNSLRYSVSLEKGRLIAIGRSFIHLFSSLNKEGKPVPTREHQEYLEWIVEVRHALPHKDQFQ